MKIVTLKSRSATGAIAVARVMAIGFCIYTVALTLLLPASSALIVDDANSALADRGHDVFQRRCTGCHSLDGDKEGPRLRGVYGRKAGSVPSFKYSDALKKAEVTWDETNLDKWLTDPDKFISDVDMDFHLEKADERSAVIAYLKQLSSK